MNKSFFVIFALFAQLFANEHINQCTEKMPKEGFLSTARHCFRNCSSGCWGGIFNATIIVWQAKEDDLEYASKNLLFDNRGLNLNATNEFPKYDFRAGFKVGLGFVTPVNDIDLYANYTYYHTNNKTRVSAPTSSDGFGLIPLWRHPVAVPTELRYRNASSKWALDFNTLDAELGYSMMASCYIDLRFHAGLKAININQEYDVRYENGQVIQGIEPTIAKVHLKNDCRGIGPRIGLQSKWRITRNFHIYSSGAAGTTLNEFDSRRRELDTAINVATSDEIITDISFTEKPWIWKPFAETIMGFGWQCCYRCFSFNADLSYEIQYFYEQSLFRRFSDAYNESLNVPSKGDLMLHGVNFQFRFDF